MRAFSDKASTNFNLVNSNAELANYQSIRWQKLLEKECLSPVILGLREINRTTFIVFKI